MSMNACFIRGVQLKLGLLFLLASITVYAQKDDSSRKKSKFIPDYINLQYAGSIGAISVAGAYDLGKKKKTHLEIFYGYSPKYQGDRTLNTVTVKGLRTLINPVAISQEHKLSWIPLKIGGGLSYVAGSEFFHFNKDLPYPEGYYWNTTGMTALAFFQTEAELDVKGKSISSINYYLEANIQDAYVTLKFSDKNFTVFDMIRLGMGIRIRF